MRPLVWFRSDLRRRDNTALIEACDAATNGVVAVFTVCPEQWRQHDWGAKRVNFLLRNLRDLSDGLARLNIPLKIITTPKFDGVPKSLLQLARQHECTALYFNKEYEVNEQRRDESVETLFHDHDLKVSSYDDQVIIPPGDVRTKEGRWYTVFTPFKKSWLTRLDDIGGVDVRRAPRKQAEVDIKPDPVPDAVNGFDARMIALTCGPKGRRTPSGGWTRSLRVESTNTTSGETRRPSMERARCRPISRMACSRRASAWSTRWTLRRRAVQAIAARPSGSRS